MSNLLVPRPVDLTHVQGVAWDLDNTLYRYNNRLTLDFNVAVARAAIEMGAPFDLMTAISMARQSYVESGFSGHVFVREHGVDAAALHQAYHDYVTHDPIAPLQGLAERFADSACGHVIVTHGSKNWGLRTRDHLGLAAYFPDDAVLGLEDYGFEEKHVSARGIDAAAERLGLPHKAMAFGEDTHRNLALAHAKGVTTVLLHYGEGADALPAHVNHGFVDAVEFMGHLPRRMP